MLVVRMHAPPSPIAHIIEHELYVWPSAWWNKEEVATANTNSEHIDLAILHIATCGMARHNLSQFHFYTGLQF